jgi:hypothetical protein
LTWCERVVNRVWTAERAAAVDPEIFERHRHIRN